jgi:hypothetical protein
MIMKMGLDDVQGSISLLDQMWDLDMLWLEYLVIHESQQDF